MTLPLLSKYIHKVLEVVSVDCTEELHSYKNSSGYFVFDWIITYTIMNKCAIVKTEKLGLTFTSAGFYSRAEMEIFCSKMQIWTANAVWIKQHS